MSNPWNPKPNHHPQRYHDTAADTALALNFKRFKHFLEVAVPEPKTKVTPKSVVIVVIVPAYSRHMF